jgi:hypothetical protein
LEGDEKNTGNLTKEIGTCARFQKNILLGAVKCTASYREIILSYYRDAAL